MRVVLASCSALPDGAPDERPVAELLGADVCVWDDPAVDWDAYDRVVVRSTWDYTFRLSGEVVVKPNVDSVAGADGEPLLLELEVVEPALYLATAPGAAERFAAAIRAS